MVDSTVLQTFFSLMRQRIVGPVEEIEGGKLRFTVICTVEFISVKWALGSCVM